MNSEYNRYDNNQKTSATFIGMLKAADEESWSFFYDKYAPIILNFARKRGCNTELAEDVLQETIIALFRHLPVFNYEKQKGKFRSYLFKIAESKIIDFFRRRKPEVQFDSIMLQNTALFGFEAEPESFALWEKAVEERILKLAMETVKKGTTPSTFKCFELTYIANLSVSEAAEKLKISPNLVSQHKHKVKKLVIEEAKKIQGGF